MLRVKILKKVIETGKKKRYSIILAFSEMLASEVRNDTRLGNLVIKGRYLYFEYINLKCHMFNAGSV